ncbi:MAG: TonB-dependent receptor [Alphaproteobacteria bacterium]|nr:TonB-dependent receptor [Alphaproteobacteria bacterium]
MMNWIPKKSLKAASVMMASTALWAAPVSAQQIAVEEIVVTGLKRSESLLDAPVAVTVFTADAIERAGITRPEDFLSLVPNVNFVTSNHQGEFFVNMRGQAGVRFAEGAVAVVVDGVQLSTQNEFNGDFFDIEQLEVLKGPQNALYGRNATAGAIIVTTKAPGDEWEGSILASYGNWKAMKLQGGIGGPLTDNIGVRLSASLTDSDGPYTNEFTGEKVHRWTNKTGRMRLNWQGENTSADFVLGGSHGTGGAIAFNAQIAGTTVGGVFIPGPDTNNVHPIPFVNDTPGINIQDKVNSSLRIIHEMDGMTLESVSSFSSIKDNYQAKGLPYADYTIPSNDFGVFEFVFGDLTQKWRDQNRAFTQEFRLSSNDDTARVRWQAGAYFQKARKIRTNINGLFTGGGISPSLLPSPIGSANPSVNYDKTKFGVTNYSPFGNIQFDITEDLQLDLAARYETEERDVETRTAPGANTVTGDATYNQCVLRTGRDPADCFDETTFHQFQPKVTLSYSLPDDTGSVYATWGKGFKSGGFNTIGVRDLLIDGAIAAGGDPSLIFTQDSYDKETTNAYEIGFKARMMDGRLALNGAVFKTDVTDAQQFEFFPVGSIQAVSRIDKQKVEGFEFDANMAVTENLTLFAGYGYVDAKITELVAQPLFEGNRVPYIEKDNLLVGAQFNAPVSGDIEVVGRVEYKRRGSIWYDSSNLPGSRRDPIELIDARIGLATDEWSLTLWGRNLNNEKYASESVPLLSILNVPFKAPTRSYGLEARYNF